MRPVRLTMQAFGPYPGRVSIDFRDALEAGLFGIYGQTGSGKSTIFSAMTFALFGQPARSEQDAPSLRSDLAEAEVQTEVEFVFDIGGKRHVILRRPEQMRPKQRGEGETRSPHEAFLFDATGMAPEAITDERRGKIVAEKKVGAVDAAVADLLGYGPEQFRQIVLLPQGRFEKFLSAKTRERLEILRDLFDVSRYRALAAHLKAEAEAAEREISEERALCARRLQTEGFESTDALAAGIAEARALLQTLADDEKAARAAMTAAQTALHEAQSVEARFTVADEARHALTALEAGRAEIDALAEQVARAEKARTLIDAEARVTEAADEARKAGEHLATARQAANDTAGVAEKAAQALRAEIERSDEFDDLRRQVETLDRHAGTLESAREIAQAVEKARKAETDAARAVAAAARKLAQAQTEARERAEALRAARAADTERRGLAERLGALNAALAAATSFEAAQHGVATAADAVSERTGALAQARQGAQKARDAFDRAEAALSQAQALHLATKLRPGEPCAVCGATDHPAPATGRIDQSGLDQAFRDARARWEQAESRAREAEGRLIGAQGVLDERRHRLAGLPAPEAGAGSDAIRARVEAVQGAIDALGRPFDLAQAEAGAEQAATLIDAATRDRDQVQQTLDTARNTAAVAQARLEQMLSPIPEALRDPAALARERAAVARALDTRRRAREAAEAADKTAREAAIAALRDCEAARAMLAASEQRRGSALAAMAARLDAAGLTEDMFKALKPAIARLETDRAQVEDHRRQLALARDAAEKAEQATRGLARPDLGALEARRAEADARLDRATDLRSGAAHRLDHLARLAGELADTLRRLDAAEAATGPLRRLAAQVNGDNPLRLDLETFAIGTMFEQVLDAANLRLGPMTAGRYRLERDNENAGRGRRGLGIQVFDIHTGKPRPTATLSGGETFIAALALALGLADVVEGASGKVRLDTIFIDEGFGSLDTENGSGTLDMVLQALAGLASESRAVGLISHVPLVQEAIPNGFYIRKTASGSVIEARNAR